MCGEDAFKNAIAQLISELQHVKISLTFSVASKIVYTFKRFC